MRKTLAVGGMCGMLALAMLTALMPLAQATGPPAIVSHPTMACEPVFALAPTISPHTWGYSMAEADMVSFLSRPASTNMPDQPPQLPSWARMGILTTNNAKSNLTNAPPAQNLYHHADAGANNLSPPSYPLLM